MLRLVSILLVTLACLSFPSLALAPVDCGTQSAGFVPSADQFAGVFLCSGPCGAGDPQPKCAQHWFETAPASNVFIGFCYCNDGSTPEPSPCCHLRYTADLNNPPSLTPSVAGNCGGECPAGNECRLVFTALQEWDPEIEE